MAGYYASIIPNSFHIKKAMGSGPGPQVGNDYHLQ
jgi:hypothetical protein